MRNSSAVHGLAGVTSLRLALVGGLLGSPGYLLQYSTPIHQVIALSYSSQSFDTFINPFSSDRSIAAAL